MKKGTPVLDKLVTVPLFSVGVVPLFIVYNFIFKVGFKISALLVYGALFIILMSFISAVAWLARDEDRNKQGTVQNLKKDCAIKEMVTTYVTVLLYLFFLIIIPMLIIVFPSVF